MLLVAMGSIARSSNFRSSIRERVSGVGNDIRPEFRGQRFSGWSARSGLLSDKRRFLLEVQVLSEFLLYLKKSLGLVGATVLSGEEARAREGESGYTEGIERPLVEMPVVGGSRISTRHTCNTES